MIKRILLLFILCLLSVELFGRTVRVATYNLGNYLISDRWANGRYTKMYPKPESEKDAIREVIATIKPDIIVVQEIGSELFLKEFQEDLSSEGLDYPFTFLMKGADTVRHIAVLSKEPLIQALPYDNLTFTFLNDERMLVRRGLLELCFRTEGFDWSLFAVHLKSRRSDRAQDYESAKQRIGEAVAVRDKIKERYPDPQKGNYLIVGDFNDSPKSKALKRFLKSGSKELSIMLPAVDLRGEVWTHYREGHGSYSQIDYILVSPILLSKIKAKGASIADTPFALKGSDHRMVYVDIDF